MGYFLEWLKRKLLCWRDGRYGCDNCKHCANGHDFWGCAFFFHAKRSSRRKR